jgi:hypothetical protein
MPTRRQTRLTIFFLWWLSTLLGIIHTLSGLFPELSDMSRFHHVAAACLIATYDTRRGKPSQGGQRVTPSWLEGLTDEQAMYHFR